MNNYVHVWNKIILPLQNLRPDSSLQGKPFPDHLLPPLQNQLLFVQEECWRVWEGALKHIDDNVSIDLSYIRVKQINWIHISMNQPQDSTIYTCFHEEHTQTKSPQYSTLNILTDQFLCSETDLASGCPQENFYSPLSNI